MQLRHTVSAIVILVCGSLNLELARTATAQSPPANPYWGRSAPSPTVSPYLNLTVDANGQSNYSSLVRPMLAQRELLANQAADEQLQSRSRLAQGRSAGSTATIDPRRIASLARS